MARLMRAAAQGAVPFDGRRDPGPPRHFLDIDQHELSDLRHMLDLGLA